MEMNATRPTFHSTLKCLALIYILDFQFSGMNGLPGIDGRDRARLVKESLRRYLDAIISAPLQLRWHAPSIQWNIVSSDRTRAFDSR